MKTGFTLIELIVSIAVVAILSGVVLFSVTQYISKGKDSNVASNLAILVPAGEVWYNGNNNSYQDFCDPNYNKVLENTLEQMPDQSKGTNAPCYDEVVTPTTNPKGVCCKVAYLYQSWAACAREFTDASSAFCVDSRGVKKQIPVGSCTNLLTQCP